MADAPRSFLGQGWHFPPSFTANGRDVLQVADEEDIRQSLAILLATTPGERLLREDFGCDLNRYLFEEMDHRLAGQVAGSVRQALVRHEPRIDVEAVDADAGEVEGTLRIQVTYRIRATNTRFNLVFPFYIKEVAQAWRP